MHIKQVDVLIWLFRLFECKPTVFKFWLFVLKAPLKCQFTYLSGIYCMQITITKRNSRKYSRVGNNTSGAPSQSYQAQFEISLRISLLLKWICDPSRLRRFQTDREKSKCPSVSKKVTCFTLCNYIVELREANIMDKFIFYRYIYFCGNKDNSCKK